MARPLRILVVVIASSVSTFGALTLAVGRPVTAERLLRAASEPRNWLMYSGTYASQRYSTLRQIDAANVTNLEQKWIFQSSAYGPWQATPLVVDGVMYVTQRPNDVVALDAKTGRAFWLFRHVPAPEAMGLCCGANNRGVAILGDTVYTGTVDGKLIAINAKTGKRRWMVTVADYKAGYTLSLAPLVVKDKVLVGPAGGEHGIKGFLTAYDAESGKEVWRFDTIPGPGEPGHETWEPCPIDASTYCDPEAWKHGGGPIWLTGSYDPGLNLTYWGIGNPGPDWNSAQRPGDNLYTNSVVALDVDTGELRWHFQFTPHDSYDYDAVQIPVLVDMTWNDEPRKLILWANRNGMFYVLDRESGQFLLGKPFVEVNWHRGLDERGRPMQTPQPPGMPTYPGNQGATNWYSPSFSPRTGLMYVPAWEEYATAYHPTPARYEAGKHYSGGTFTTTGPVPDAPTLPFWRGPINNWTDASAHGSVIAIDPRTGDRKWTYRMFDVTDSGVLTTASDLLFTGGREGYFQALDARTGALLWKASLGTQITNGPITYEVGGRQYVATISGQVLAAYALRDR